MGCWNETCAITNLPILAGEEVVVYPLIEQQGYHSKCYHTTYFKPIVWSFTGKYDEYGGVEKCKGPFLDQSMDFIRKAMVELPVGENKIHDVATVKSELSAKTFFEYTHEGRLYATNIHRNTGNIGNKSNLSEIHRVLIRKNVVAAMKEKFKCESWNRETNSYDILTYANYMQAGMDWLKSITGPPPVSEEDDPVAYIRWKYGDEFAPPGPFYPVVEVLKYQYTAEYAKTKLINATVKDQEAFVDLLVTYFIIDHFMQSGRRMWIPPSGAGSQDQETDVQCTLAHITLDESVSYHKRLSKRYEE